MVKQKYGLIVVDMQYDFVNPEGNLYVPGAEKLIEPINKLINKFIELNQQIIYTQDWHKEDSLIFKQWPMHCVAHTPNAEIVVDIPKPADSIFIKKGLYDFENYGAFEGTPDLNKLLKLRGIENILVCGVAGDYCVYWTIYEGLRLGYTVYAIIDLIKSIDTNKTKELYSELADEYESFHVITLDELLKKIEEEVK